jgi:hypothetical protein
MDGFNSIVTASLTLHRHGQKNSTVPISTYAAYVSCAAYQQREDRRTPYADVADNAEYERLDDGKEEYAAAS